MSVNINIGRAERSVVIGGNVANSSISSGGDSKLDLSVIDEAAEAVSHIDDESARRTILAILEEMKATAGTPPFVERYKEFVVHAANHVTVLSPFLGKLASLLG